MRAVLTTIDSGARSLAYFLGVIVIALAIGKAATSLDTATIAAWTWHVYGATFLALFALMTFVTLFCWTQMRNSADRGPVWFEAGMHAAGGIAILALTFTLLGICMGIASLNGQELSPETIHEVMGRLTANFSMAFLADVLGLPTSSALRALLSVTAVAHGISTESVPARRSANAGSALPDEPLDDDQLDDDGAIAAAPVR